MSLTEKQINGKTVYDGKIIKVSVDEVLLPDGRRAKRECVRHSGGAAVLLVKQGKVLLVRQFRYLYGKEIYEIPAGKLNAGEDPCVAAQRELEEETGYKAELKSFLRLYPTPGYTDEVIHVYLAEKFREGEQRLDDGEFLNYTFIPLDKAVEMIEKGEICDSKTVSAIYKYIAENKKNSK